MWQYSHTGRVNGIDTAVDLNDCYEMMKTAGLNGYTKPDDVNYIRYTVATDESLWAIAEKYLGSGLRYTEIKALNDLQTDTIYTGQILKIPSK